MPQSLAPQLSKFLLLSLLASPCGEIVYAASGELPAVPRNGQLVLFGDSITAYGDRPGGWVRSLRADLAGRLGRPDIRVVNAGQGGNVVQDLHRRFFWRSWRRPDLVVVCIGINDARSAADLGYSDLDLQEYRSGLDDLVGKMIAVGSAVVMASPIIFGEQTRGRNAFDGIVDAYARAAQEVADSRSLPFLDLRSLFFERLSSLNLADVSVGVLTYDGLHLNQAGNALMAELVLERLRSLPPKITEQ